jgi:fumarate hydratase class II
VFAHGAINSAATGLFKIANDIRLLGSSAFRPWRIDPAENELACRSCRKVNLTPMRSHDHGLLPGVWQPDRVTIAGSQGHFELNVHAGAGILYDEFYRAVVGRGSLFTEHCVVGTRRRSAHPRLMSVR